MENLIIGQYRLKRKIGQGGMAEVWEAVHLQLGEPRAVKFLLPAYSGDEILEARFLAEGQRQAALHHPNIVKAYDFLNIGERNYMVMEFVSGCNLESKIIQNGGPLSFELIRNISYDILSAIGYAHSRGEPVVHRDVKPSNVLLDDSGRTYLTDFGIALVMGSERRLTATGSVIGTPDYMSPEQILRPKDVDWRSDIYSFGCVLYAMLTGNPPFAAEEATEYTIKDAHVRNPPPPMAAKNPLVTDAIEHVVRTCMAKDRNERYQTAREVWLALEPVLEGKPAPAPAPADGPSQTQTRQPNVQHPLPPPASLAGNDEAPVSPVGRNRLYLLLAGLVAGFALLYIFWPAATPSLRFEGSTTVGDALVPALLEGFAAQRGATDIRRESEELTAAGKESGTVEKFRRITVRASIPGKWAPEIYQVTANGSGNAFSALAKNTADIGMASRQVKADDLKNRPELADLRSSATEHIVALDGIAIVVNRGNGIRTLSRQNLALIYSGRISDWSALGGFPRPIHLFGRNAESGTYDSFVAMVMGGHKELLSKSIEVKGNGEAIAEAVGLDPGGIGYVGLAQIGSARAVPISDGAGTTALMPTSFTVATENYILQRRLYLYTTHQPSPLAQQFIAFAEGPGGQAIVKKAKFVEQTGEAEQVGLPPAAPSDYRVFVAGKRRVKTDFHFDSGRTTLDNKSLADVERVVNAVSSNRNAKVWLAGFADNVGNYSANCRISRERAAEVSKTLSTSGLVPLYSGFCSELPLADNATEEGRKRNRRVEVWVQ